MSEAQATVGGIFRSGERGAPMEPLGEAMIVADWGIDGDRKARAGSRRQVYLVDQSTLDAVALDAGALRENITVRGMPVNTLQPGTRLRLGGALLEVTMPCTVCGELDDLRSGLKEALRDRRGILTRVVAGGVVRLGDAISIVEP